MGQLRSPNGTTIKGTKEIVPGCALIGTVRGIGDNGVVDFDYDGSTQMYWDDQQTVRRPFHGRNGVSTHRVFIDEDGTEWLENELVFIEEDQE